MNGFNTLGWWGKNRVLPNVGSLNRGGDIILSLSLYGFHHGAVANSPDIDEIVCDYYDHIGVLWTEKKRKVLEFAMKIGETCNIETSFELDLCLQILKVSSMACGAEHHAIRVLI